MRRREWRGLGALAAVLLVAAVLRLYGIRWGLPEVFEEATPMREAWRMGGWGARPFDPNPHFFNYPSLVIYLQLLAQGILYAVLKSAGTITSALDFRVLYATDKTAFVTAGRYVTAAFGTATVGLVFALARRFSGRLAATFAALLVAVNAVHIDNSQMVSVDVPLTFFGLLALWASLRILDAPTRGRYVMAGVCVGLAASAKYTGALLAVSVVAAHLSARHTRRAAPPAWTLAFVSGVAALVAFLATSPFVLLDFSTFLRHFSVEQYHMEAGHFGLGGASSWRAYAGWLAGGALGWPLFLFGAGGLVYLAVVRRRPWALVLGAFTVIYAASVGSWSMRAERYLLPLIPVLTLFAVALVVEGTKRLARTSAPVRATIVAVVAAVIVAPLAAAFPAHVQRYRPDPRALARQWIEANLPAGSFVVTEAYGPQLFSPLDVWQLDDVVRTRVFSARSERPYYALQEIPMYQVDPERSGVFYDPRLVAMADMVITTDAVRGRYHRDPARYARQLAFYRALDQNYDVAADIPGGAAGSGMRLYRSRVHTRRFAERGDAAAPPPLEAGLPAAPGAQERFYFNFGIDYEAFNYYAAAYQCYENAFRYSVNAPLLLADVSMGMARCLDALGQRDRAVELLSRVLAVATDDEGRARIQHLHDVLAGRP